MRLGDPGDAPAPAPGARVLVDARPLGDPDRAPATAAYLRGLLGACALRAVWADERVWRGIAAAAAARAGPGRRTWSDVARETRDVYAEVAGLGRP